jgi:DNA-binding MarR family transcriptional regulator
MVLGATRALVGIAAHSLAEVSDEVSLAQYRVLVLLDAGGPSTMGDLATSLDVNPSTVTRVCDVLIDKKLIRRAPAKDNRRVMVADLTARGRKLVALVMGERRRLVTDSLARMSPESRRALATSLSEFAEAAGEVSSHAWTLGWTVEPSEPSAGS